MLALSTLLLAAVATAMPLDEYLEHTLATRAIPGNVRKVTIHPKGASQCLTVQGDTTWGSKVAVADCNRNSAKSQWVIAANGATLLQNVAQDSYGQKFCIQSPGTAKYGVYYPRNGESVLLTGCNDDNWPVAGTFNWGITWDIKGGTMFGSGGTGNCLDNADGGLCNGNKVQTWDCHASGHPDYKNQLWDIREL